MNNSHVNNQFSENLQNIFTIKIYDLRQTTENRSLKQETCEIITLELCHIICIYIKWVFYRGTWALLSPLCRLTLI